MALFELIVDEKVAVWKRSYITVEADSLEQAVESCIESGADIATDTSDSNYIFETEECINPSDKDHFTVEVMNRNFEILGNNESLENLK